MTGWKRSHCIRGHKWTRANTYRGTPPEGGVAERVTAPISCAISNATARLHALEAPRRKPSRAPAQGTERATRTTRSSGSAEKAQARVVRRRPPSHACVIESEGTLDGWPLLRARCSCGWFGKQTAGQRGLDYAQAAGARHVRSPTPIKDAREGTRCVSLTGICLSGPRCTRQAHSDLGRARAMHPARRPDATPGSGREGASRPQAALSPPSRCTIGVPPKGRAGLSRDPQGPSARCEQPLADYVENQAAHVWHRSTPSGRRLHSQSVTRQPSFFFWSKCGQTGCSSATWLWR